MLKALVVEDEKLEREALTKLIRDKFHEQIEQVVAVSNGSQALEIFQQESYQLVFTDINTPKMTGLEFLRKIKEVNPKVRSIIVTGYDYFEYAQEAIRIGVDDFILKPATQKEIGERIENILKRMSDDGLYETAGTSRFQEIQAILQNDLIYSILYQENAAGIQKYFAILHLHVKSAVCFCLERKEITLKQIDAICKEVQGAYLSCCYGMYFENVVLYVFHDSLLQHKDICWIKEQIQKIIGEYKKIKWGGIKEAVEEYYDSYVEARNHDAMSGENHVLKNTEYYNVIKCLSDDLLSAVFDGNLCILNEQVALEFKKFCFGMNKEQLQEMLTLFFRLLSDKLMQYEGMEKSLKILEVAMERVVDVNNIQQAFEMVSSILHEIVYPIVEKQQAKMNKLILLSYRYIQEHYHQPIGLNDLAKYLDVTPQYICTLLSQHKKTNFTNILAEYRIAQAKRLLIDNKKIKEVANLVGFQNQNYFAKTFKKITGYTPNEYRSFYQFVK